MYGRLLLLFLLLVKFLLLLLLLVGDPIGLDHLPVQKHWQIDRMVLFGHQRCGHGGQIAGSPECD